VVTDLLTGNEMMLASDDCGAGCRCALRVVESALEPEPVESTPGPWAKIVGDKCFRIYSEAGHELAVIYPSAYEDSAEANANLIAAAPELLGALKALLEAARIHRFGLETAPRAVTVRDVIQGLGISIDIAERAIAKIGGER